MRVIFLCLLAVIVNMSAAIAGDDPGHFESEDSYCQKGDAPRPVPGVRFLCRERLLSHNGDSDGGGRHYENPSFSPARDFGEGWKLCGFAILGSAPTGSTRESVTISGDNLLMGFEATGANSKYHTTILGRWYRPKEGMSPSVLDLVDCSGDGFQMTNWHGGTGGRVGGGSPMVMYCGVNNAGSPAWMCYPQNQPMNARQCGGPCP
jgi:hypothetical protein